MPEQLIATPRKQRLMLAKPVRNDQPAMLGSHHPVRCASSRTISICGVLVLAFQNRGYDVLEARNRHEALASSARRRPI
jgi:hypothetical protein